MSQRALILLALFSLLPDPSRAQHQDSPRQKGVLARAIRLVEEPEEKKGPFPMPFGTTPQDVDINSTIRIRVSQADLLAGLSGNPVLTDAAAGTVALRKSSEQLRQAETLLQLAIAEATTLARLDLAGRRDSPEFQQAAEQDQADLNAMFAIVTAHLDALKSSPRADHRQHAAEARERSNQAILQGAGERLLYAAFLVEEIQWTLQQLQDAEARLEKDSPSMALILSASLVRPGGTTAAGLPHYDNLPIGTPKSVDKLNLALTPEQIALHQETAALAKVLNQAIAGSAELRDAVSKLLSVHGIDIEALEDALAQVKEDADTLQDTDWTRVGRDLEEQLREALEDATAAQRKILEDKVLPQTEELQVQAKAFQSSLPGLVSSVSSLRSQLSQSSGQDPTGQVIALLSLARIASELSSGEIFASLRSEVDRWTQAARALQSQAKEIRTSTAGLPAQLRDQAGDILEQAKEDRLGSLVTNLGELRIAADNVAVQLKAFASGLKGAPELAIALNQKPPDVSFRVAFKDIKDTWLDVRTLNPRDENDVVVVRAWLYSMKPDPNDPSKVIEDQELDSDLQQLRLLRFGWYANPAVGLVYLSSQDEVEQNGDAGKKEVRAFAPQVSWLLNRRPWQAPGDGSKPFRYQPGWLDSVALGLHTVSLDLDNDNQQELGLGISLSFARNFLQIGAGLDLSLDDEPYFFIGTRLLEIARNLGESNKPAAPPE